MKHLALCVLIAAALPFSAAGGNEMASAVEGLLVDWNGNPVPGVKITAVQAERLVAGYEQFETVTDADGAFRLEGLFPSWEYVLKPWSDKWTSDTSMQIETAPRGETEVLRKPLVIERAYLRSDGSRVANLITFGPRFSVSAESVISDDATNLEWIVGPEEQMTSKQAEEWLAACDIAGGGWRLPLYKELTDFRPNTQEMDMEFLQGTADWSVWAMADKNPVMMMAHGYHPRHHPNRRTGMSQQMADENYVFGVRPRQANR
ncbi:MAG TPA: carboxypeptidase regulatory-like domain-containing protein [Candidatus Hydrogenedentes bacterium]|nr:carboxypeptidase regulatory-like domain-containing protein [Candidatus Hydrogenedentota bacterium]